MAYRIAKCLDRLRSQVNTRWPKRKTDSDGWIGDAIHAKKSSDHNPHVKDGSTGVVTALDITHDPKSGCDTGILADVLVASRDPRIKYIIWNKRIISGDAGPSPWKWRKYSGPNPHTMHVHISVKAAKAKYDDVGNWAMSGAVPPKVPSAPQPPVAAKKETLKLGSKGKLVSYLQKLLGIPVTGVFEDSTEKAVKKFQAKKKLVADGVVGPYTWAALVK